MKSLITGAVIASAVAALGAGAARADVSLVDNNKTVKVDCTKDPKLAVLGNHLNVTATGLCNELTIAGNQNTFTGSAVTVSVPGNHNTVNLGGADNVSVPGNYNTVTVKTGIRTTGAPSVSNIGGHNTVNGA